MNVIICSVPVEAPGDPLRRKRSESQYAMIPKTAINSLNYWAVKNGFNACKFYDIDMLYPSDEEIKKYFSENQADVVGLSAVVSTSYLQVKRLARIIKEINKKTLVICGGYLTAAANTVLKKTEVDICVVGNGEIAWVGILRYSEDYFKKEKEKLDIDKLLEIKGIAVLDENRNLRFSGYGKTIPGSEMPFPDYEFLKSGLQGDDEAMQNYFRPFWTNEGFSMDSRSHEKNRKPMMINIFSSLGCVAKCTFCQRGSKGYRVYDLSKFEKFLKHVIEYYNVGFICLSDENFGTNKKYTYQCVDLFKKYNLLWVAHGVRCTNVLKEDVVHYKKNGCCGLQFGIESGSQTMLDIMEKKFTVDDIKKALFTCFDNDLYSPPVGFMFGMPGESLRTARESGKFLGEVAARIGVSPGLIFGQFAEIYQLDPYYAIPLIGTPLYEYGRRLGLVGQNVDEEEKYLISVSNVGGYKRYYINFNGAPVSEIVFWDMLFYLEATRTFVKLTKNKTLNTHWEKKFKIIVKVKGTNPHQTAKDSKGKKGLSFTPYFITNFLRRHVVFNKFLAKVPRFILYPVVRYLLYFEFLIQKYLLRDSHNLHNLHKITNKKVGSEIRIKYEDIDPTKTTQMDRSLRNIIINKMKQNNKNKQEETLSMLTSGP